MLAIVPARLGSTLPDKNLRLIDDVPMVLATLDKLVLNPHITRLVVSTNDPTVAGLCRLHDYEVQWREDAVDPAATIQDVVDVVCAQLSYTGPVGVFQPTSPTLTADSILDACARFAENPGWDSLASVIPDTALMHDREGRPLFDAYTNRQSTPPLWRRTGGIQLSRTPTLVGPVHHLYELPPEEGVDVDTVADLHAARLALAKSKSICFYVEVGEATGSGHLRRCLQLAHELDHHTVYFALPPTAPDWAYDLVPYRAFRRGTEPAPHLAIVDCLDTNTAFMASLAAGGTRILSLEDLGPGAAYADFVVNELYDIGTVTGPRYAVLRPEFHGLPPYPIRPGPVTAQTILVSFGGTDPTHLTCRAVRALQATAANVRAIAPPSHDPGETEILRGTYATVVEHPVMAAEMYAADLLVTSCGRTVHEAAAVGLPTLAIAVNARESRHSLCPGVIYLGNEVTFTDATLPDIAGRLLANDSLRSEISDTMKSAVDGKGARRIAHLAEGLLEGL